MLEKTDDTEKVAEMPQGDVSSSEKSNGYALKTTKAGIPLVPQPSDDPDDPLVSTAPSEPRQVAAVVFAD